MAVLVFGHGSYEATTPARLAHRGRAARPTDRPVSVSALQGTDLLGNPAVDGPTTASFWSAAVDPPRLDRVSERFEESARLTTGLSGETLTVLLDDGRVLVVGGEELGPGSGHDQYRQTNVVEGQAQLEEHCTQPDDDAGEAVLRAVALRVPTGIPRVGTVMAYPLSQWMAKHATAEVCTHQAGLRRRLIPRMAFPSWRCRETARRVQEGEGTLRMR